MFEFVITFVHILFVIGFANEGVAHGDVLGPVLLSLLLQTGQSVWIAAAALPHKCRANDFDVKSNYFKLLIVSDFYYTFNHR